jgi:hypothetical protein
MQIIREQRSMSFVPHTKMVISFLFFIPRIQLGKPASLVRRSTLGKPSVMFLAPKTELGNGCEKMKIKQKDEE